MVGFCGGEGETGDWEPEEGWYDRDVGEFEKKKERKGERSERERKASGKL